jgi:transcriptional regulator with XRE-family HTH domain
VSPYLSSGVVVEGVGVERFGEKVRTLRERRGLTVRQLAALLEISSHSHVVLIESSKRKPSVEMLLKLMEVFKVSCDQLLNDELEV